MKREDTKKVIFFGCPARLLKENLKFGKLVTYSFPHFFNPFVKANNWLMLPVLESCEEIYRFRCYYLGIVVGQASF